MNRTDLRNRARNSGEGGSDFPQSTVKFVMRHRKRDIFQPPEGNISFRFLLMKREDLSLTNRDIEDVRRVYLKVSAKPKLLSVLTI
jgi:hypothetical protein